MVHELIKNGADVNASDCTRQTSLHMVVYRNNMDVTNLLLQNKANVNSVDKFKVTPLMAAAERGNSDLLELLLKHGACPNMTDMGFRTALDGAILENSRKVQKRHCCLLLICYGAVIREGILNNLKECTDLMRSGKPVPKDLRQTNINTLEKEFIYCIALTLAVRCPGVAHKVFSTVHRFITFNGLFMAKGFRLGMNNVWDFMNNSDISAGNLFDNEEDDDDDDW